MNKCIELAQRGLGTPIPTHWLGLSLCPTIRSLDRVGIKKQENHMRGNAIRSVQDTSALPTSTLYVNLEPCSHHGKTPPCTDLIIQSGIHMWLLECLTPLKK